MKQTNSFYKTTGWKNCRDAYAHSVGGLCERCFAKGWVVPGEIVHHKIHLDAESVKNPEIALNWDNLELLCRDCHGIEHRKMRRYKVDALGRVEAK